MRGTAVKGLARDGLLVVAESCRYGSRIAVPTHRSGPGPADRKTVRMRRRLDLVAVLALLLGLWVVPGASSSGLGGTADGNGAGPLRPSDMAERRPSMVGDVLGDAGDGSWAGLIIPPRP